MFEQSEQQCKLLIKTNFWRSCAPHNRAQREIVNVVEGSDTRCSRSMARYHWVCEEAKQWQACTNGILLLPGMDRSFARRLEYRAEPPGKKFQENRFRHI